MTDWQTCSVVRDRDGDLWGAPNSTALSGRWNRIGSAPLKRRAAWSDELETAYGPLTPVLDADGLPVVRTVGDLTARHINRAGASAGVPLHRLLALVWEQGKRDGIKQSDWEHGDTPTMFVARNPYREVTTNQP